jgi:hypothetical protein
MTVRKIVIRFCNNIRHFSNEMNKRGGGILFCGGWNFSKSVKVTVNMKQLFLINSPLSSFSTIVYTFLQTLPRKFHKD